MPSTSITERQALLSALRCAPSLKSLFNAMNEVYPRLTNAEYLAHMRPAVMRLRGKSHEKAKERVPMTCFCR